MIPANPVKLREHSAFLWLLALGLFLRCVALTDPLVDANLLRQGQTAAATKGIISQPGLALSSQIPWLGNLDARFVLELPIYNYLVRAVHAVTGNLDLSGKLVSVALWGLSFIVLQGIWRRCLTPAQTLWANFIFVVSPLGWFYGQAFMPETLVQTLAFGFILLTLRYVEQPTLARWAACATVGLLGFLVKLPEVAHLYLILAVLVFSAEKWRAFISPRYLVAGIITVAAVKGWGSYMDSVNAAYLPEWTSKANLQGFIGPLGDRLHIKPWGMVVAYLGAFVVPGPVALATAGGLWVLLRSEARKILGLWLISVAVFYVVWFGNTAAKQSYYNLVALAPLCGLTGIGISALLERSAFKRWPRVSAGVVAAVVFLIAMPVAGYMFKPDRRMLAPALWLRANTQPGEVALFCPHHRWDMVDYPYNPLPAYYSDRPVFIWAGATPEAYRKAALERARYAVVTLPQPPPGGIVGAINRFRGTQQFQLQPTDWLGTNGFEVLAKKQTFTVYRRR